MRHLQTEDRPALAGQVRHMSPLLPPRLPQAPPHPPAQEVQALWVVSSSFKYILIVMSLALEHVHIILLHTCQSNLKNYITYVYQVFASLCSSSITYASHL